MRDGGERGKASDMPEQDENAERWRPLRRCREEDVKNDGRKVENAEEKGDV